MRMPDIDSTVFTAQAGPPTSYAVLNIAFRSAPTCSPVVSLVQAGRSTRVSRGTETTSAEVCPLSTWTTIAVSERAAPSSAPYAELAPERESEPSTRMSSAPSSASSGRSAPSAASMSTARMLPSSVR